jgi:autotransporter-associated beta strand protein
MHRLIALVRPIGAALFALIITAPAQAQITYTWTGGGSDANWITAANWSASSGSPPPANDLANTNLLFTGITQLANTQNYSFSANSLTFDAGAGAFVVSGNETLTLGSGGITVLGTSSQTFNSGLALGAAGTWANNGTGVFTVGGTVNVGAFALTVGGSGNSVYNGVISGTGVAGVAGTSPPRALLKTGAGTVTLNAVNTYTGPTAIAGGTLAFGVNDAISSSRLELGTFTFSTPGTATTGVSASDQINLNFGSTSQTVAGLYSFNVNAVGTPHTITIASGQTLTVTNNGSGNNNSVHTAFGAYNAAGAGVQNHTTLTGGGSFVVNTPNGSFQVGQTGGLGANQLPVGYPQPNSANGSLTTLNLQALSSFSATVANFRVGDFTGGGGAGSAILNLSPTTTIVTGDFVIASGRFTNSSTAGVASVRLGNVTNTIQANNMYIGGDVPSGISNPRTAGELRFLSSSLGDLIIRNQAGTGGANLFVGLQRNGSGTFARNNVMNLNNHPVDILLNTFQVGGLIGGTSTANTGNVTGTFSFDQGTVEAATLTVGNRIGTTAAQNNTGAAAGTVNVGGGTLTITGSGPGALVIGNNTMVSSSVSGSGNQLTDGTLNVSGGALTLTNGGITLATNTGSYAGGSATFATTGLLNITGGSVTVAGDIINGAATSPGTSTSTLTLNGTGAVLDLGGNRIGGTTAGEAIDVLNLQVGTLQNVLEINSGIGLTKSTTGTLTLAGTNSYTGATTVTDGTLTVGSNTAIPTGATAGNVVLNGGATAGILDLAGFSPTINGLEGTTGATLGVVENSAASTTSTLTVGNNNATGSFEGIIRDNGGTGGTVALTKTGTGILILTGNNTYSAGTAVNGGNLIVNGQSGTNSGTGTGAVDVNTGGTLEGNGRVAGNVTVNSGGRVSGGDTGVGTLTIGGDLTFNTGAQQGFRISSEGTPAAVNTGLSSTGTNNNFIDIGGSLIPNGDTSTYQFVINGTGASFDPQQTYSYQIGVIGTSAVAFLLNNQAQFSTIGFNDPFLFSIAAPAGANAPVFLNLTPIPEPATVLGLAAGALSLGGFLRRRKLRRA